MQRFLTLFQKCDLDHFTQASILAYLKSVLAKSRSSRDKLTELKANHSTPILNRAFFVRRLRTSKINSIKGLFSMVGRKGQPLAVGCFPLTAVCHPFTSYRPTVTSQAVSLLNQLKDTATMYQFIFASIRRTDLTNKIQKIRIIADSEQEARSRLAKDFILCFAGKIPFKTSEGV